MDDKDLEYIQAIADEKSISKAAARLYITQPALSLFLGRIEKQVGRQLFLRGPDGLELTYAGECWLKMARRRQKAVRDFELKMCGSDANYAGRLKIGTSAHIGSYVLPVVLPELKKRFSNLKISLTEGHSGLLERMIADGGLDIALMHLPLKELDADCAPVVKERYVAAFAHDHPAREHIYEKPGEKRPFIRPEIFRDDSFVLAFPYQRVRQICDRILSRAGIDAPRIVLTTSSVQTALRFAEAGMGVTFLPESYLNLFPSRRGTHLCYMENRYQAQWTLAVVSPKGSELNSPERAFIRLAKRVYR